MDKNSELTEKLRELDAQRMPFFQAKDQLLKAGYSEQQIAHALYSFSYDGKPNAPKQHDPVTSYYAENPQEAEKVGKYILDNAAQSGYGHKAANYLASQYAPGLHAKSKYSLAFADQIGYPYFAALLSLIPTFALVVKYDLSGNFLYAGPILVTIYWLLKNLWNWLSEKVRKR